MTSERIAQLRAKAAWLDQQAMRWIKRVPVNARIVLALFLLAALLMAIHTTLTAKDASLHLKLQHGFRSVRVSLWVDNDIAFSGRITGAPKKKFGLIPCPPLPDTRSASFPPASVLPLTLCQKPRSTFPHLLPRSPVFFLQRLSAPSFELPGREQTTNFPFPSDAKSLPAKLGS